LPALNEEKMKSIDNSRKKFLLWSSTILAGLTLFRFVKKEKKTETVKMLTRDGKLVTIDKNLLKGKGNKIQQKDLQTWITRK
jgi:hypothetical protein